jgi:hypothetical protein
MLWSQVRSFDHDLYASLMIDFPANPTVGQSFTAAGVTWIWDGVKWLPSGLSPTVVPGINDNRLINGDMHIDQRGVASGGGGTAFSYTVDRWIYSGSQPTKGTWTRSSTTMPGGFPYYLQFTSSSAYALLTSDYFQFYQFIEADFISDFMWGTLSAQPVTLSFWVFSFLTGTFGGSLSNGTTTRCYPFTYSIPAANTWTKIVITIPGDTTGTWMLSGNGAGVGVHFDLGSGATYRGPANAWAGTNYVGATGTVSVVSTNGAFLLFTGVKLEIGNVATSYNRQSLAKSMADCQRYYQAGQIITSGYANAAGMFIYWSSLLPVVMRAAPTVVPTVQNLINCGSLAGGQYTSSTVWLQAAATATGQFTASASFTASAEL